MSGNIRRISWLLVLTIWNFWMCALSTSMTADYCQELSHEFSFEQASMMPVLFFTNNTHYLPKSDGILVTVYGFDHLHLIMLQARYASGESTNPVSHFTAILQTIDCPSNSAFLMNCSHKNSSIALLPQDPSNLTGLSAIWVPPDHSVGDITFVLAVFDDKMTEWRIFQGPIIRADGGSFLVQSPQYLWMNAVVQVFNKINTLWCLDGTTQIHVSQICDGFFDCISHEDESSCHDVNRRDISPSFELSFNSLSSYSQGHFNSKPEESSIAYDSQKMDALSPSLEMPKSSYNSDIMPYSASFDSQKMDALSPSLEMPKSSYNSEIMPYSASFDSQKMDALSPSLEMPKSIPYLSPWMGKSYNTWYSSMTYSMASDWMAYYSAFMQHSSPWMASYSSTYAYEYMDVASFDLLNHTCGNGEVIPFRWTCDLWKDCADDSDEFPSNDNCQPGKIGWLYLDLRYDYPNPCGDQFVMTESYHEVYIELPTDFDANTYSYIYFNDMRCRWTITALDHQLINLEFLLMSIEYDTNCQYDYIQLYDFDVPAVFRYCGDYKPDFISTTNRIDIVFVSDQTITMAGFVIKVTTLNKTPNVELPSGQIADATEVLYCPDGSSLNTHNLCDGTPQCSDLWDESPAAGCQVFHCQNMHLVPLNNMCNGHDDCGDNSDESAQAGCVESMKCPDGSTDIYEHNICDGFMHCPDAWDESEEAGCTGMFMCLVERDLIPASWKCDGNPDCSDGSDESSMAGCIVNLCLSVTCLNDGTCLNGSCLCNENWTGEKCQTDIHDDCTPSPCTDGSRCIDDHETYHCLCAHGYTGANCGIYVGIAEQYLLHVKTQDGECRNSLECDTLVTAIHRAKPGSKLELLAGVHKIPMKVFITKSLEISGEPSSIVAIHLDVVLMPIAAGAPFPTVSFYGLTLMGTIAVGNATLIIQQCNTTNLVIEQEHYTGLPLSYIGLDISETIMRNSTVANRPNSYDKRPFIIFQKCNLTLLLVTDIEMHSSTFNATSENVQMVLTSLKAYGSENQTDHIPVIARIGVNLFELWESSYSIIKKRSAGVNEQKYAGLNLPGGKHSFDEDLFQRIHEASDTNHVRIAPAHKTALFEKFKELESKKRHRRSNKDEIEFESFVDIQGGVFSELHPHKDIGVAVVQITGYRAFSSSIRASSFTQNDRAISIGLLKGDEVSVYINQCSFSGNKATGPGGAVLFYQSAGYSSFKVDDCSFDNNIAIGLQSDELGEQDDTDTIITLETSKITGSGGALAMIVSGKASDTFCAADLRYNVFMNNTAENYGGSVYITPKVSAILTENTMSNSPLSDITRPRVGDILESRGDMYMVNNTFLVKSAQNDISIISYRADKDGSFMESNLMDFLCPKGFQVNPIYSAIKTAGTRMPIDSMAIYCISCIDGQYSLDMSHVIVDQSHGLNIDTISNSTCLACPYGASCHINVHSKYNFWGVEFMDEVHMYLCPEDYCCQQRACDSFNICAKDRVGVLCGRCEEGFSESLFSKKCIEDSKCTYASWFWLVVAVYGIAYVLFFILQEEAESIMRMFSDWFKNKITKLHSHLFKSSTRQDIPSQEVTPCADRKEGAFLSIFMYYVQVPSLLRLKILYAEERNLPLDEFLNSVKEYLSFNTFGIQLNTCVAKGTSMIFKTWLHSAFILYCFAVWFIMFIIGLPIGILYKPKPGSKFPANITTGARFTGALVALLLYTYQYFAENAFIMLKCVNIQSINTTVLFVDAEIECYQEWQYGVLGLVLIYILPFFLVLLFAPTLIKKRIISVKIFIASILLPLFSSPVLIYLAVKHRNTGDEMHIQRKKRKKITTVTKVLNDIYEPYRQDLKFGICWEGVIALRRLLLVVSATLVDNVLIRHLLMSLVCFFSILLQMKYQAFSKRICNYTENASLTILAWISVMNLLKASYFESGDIPMGFPDHLFYYWDWIEAGLSGGIPFLIVVILIISTCVRILSYIAKIAMAQPADDSFEDQDNSSCFPPRITMIRYQDPLQNDKTYSNSFSSQPQQLRNLYLPATNQSVHQNDLYTNQLHGLNNNRMQSNAYGFQPFIPPPRGNLRYNYSPYIQRLHQYYQF